MDRRALLVVSVGALVVVLFAFVTSAGGVGLWTEPSIDLVVERSDRDPFLPTDPAEVGASDPDETTTVELPAVVEWLLAAVGISVAVVTIGALLVYSWRNRPRLRWRRPEHARGQPFDTLPDVAAVVIDDAAAQRAELRRGSARNAIVKCWLRLERAVERAGLERDDADTPAEFTNRVLAHYAVDRTAIDRLADLYREARFSDHDLGEPEREAALMALDALHRSLHDAAIVGSVAR
jgi:Domain of unknown function (DUF4129)